ncbi:MAG: hypothetical protein R3B95_17915 [Nitrospirales bacterium]|nr:hypothetical protein [Nitrospirales bacterium]
MPCDSAAAGLIALGALIRDLENSIANDGDGHYDSMLRYARQYLECCRDCTMRCWPEIKGCGCAAEARGLVRDKRGKLHQIVAIKEGAKWYEQAIVCFDPRKDATRCILRQSATDWRIDGEPPPQMVTKPETALPGEAYVRIVKEAKVVSDNLCKTFSGLCLAGRVTGETASRKQYAAIRFKSEEGEYDLPNLLTVHGWSPSKILSRMTFFNARTGLLDRRSCEPALVVADGAECFLKILAGADFQRSDVIGVIHRIIERDQLEDVGNRMIGLRQWYVEDSELLAQLRDQPCGISVSILSRSTF